MIKENSFWTVTKNLAQVLYKIQFVVLKSAVQIVQVGQICVEQEFE